MHFPPKLFLLLSFPVLLTFNASAQSVSDAPGIEITTRFGFVGNTSEHTVYLQRDRKRMEYQNSTGGPRNPDGTLVMHYGPRIVLITRCDLGQAFELNLDASEFVISAYPPKPLTREEMDARGLKMPKFSETDKPTLRIETAVSDTGQRREFFGRTARRVITTTKEIPLEGSHTNPQETVTDGWYIDLDQRISCDHKWPEGKGVHGRLVGWSSSQPPEKIEYVNIGEAQPGFPLQQTTTSKGTYALPDGTKKESHWTSEVEVTVLEEGPLDARLFEVPAGFRRVDHIEHHATQKKEWSEAWEEFKAKVESIFHEKAPHP